MRESEMQELGIFSRNLYNYRTRAKLTQREVAAKIGVRQQTVAAWEANRSTPSPDVLCELARMFNITTDELLLYGLQEDGSWPKRRVMVPLIEFAHIHNPKAYITKDTEHIFMEGEYGKDYLCTHMPDDSMQPYIMPEDKILLSLNKKLKNNDVGVIIHKKSNALVRKIVREEAGYILVPLANTFDITFVPDEKMKEWAIIGKVEATLRSWQ